MSVIDIYTQPWCPYCSRAVHLLSGKGVAFHEINAPHGSAERQEFDPPLRRTHHRAADFHW